MVTPRVLLKDPPLSQVVGEYGGGGVNTMSLGRKSSVEFCSALGLLTQLAGDSSTEIVRYISSIQ